MTFQKLLISSTNKGKIKEIKTFFQSSNISLITLDEVVSKQARIQIRETGKTFSQNASIKAQIIGERTRIQTLADDSGLMIDALNGKPGIYSARIARTDQERIKLILKKMKNIPESKRTAKFEAAVAIYNPKTKKTTVFLGEVIGNITRKPIGSKGFGYDPIFFSDELGKTFAQATIEEKNEVSHRARALKKAIKYLS